MNFKEVRLIRMLMWVLLYLVLVFLLIFLLVVPVVREYRSVNQAFAEQKLRYRTAQGEYRKLSEKLDNLRSKHRKVIAAFENRWDKARFVQTAQRFFQRVEVVPVETNLTDPGFRIYEINARARMESPQNFYRFLDALPTIPYVIEADFPIAFRAYGKARQIEGIFRIRVYEERSRSSRESNASRQPESTR